MCEVPLGVNLQYIVSSGGGAFMNEKHKIPNINQTHIAGVTESDFHCYPLRGDSLSVFSRNYGLLFSLGRLRHWLGFGRLTRLWFIPPDRAATIIGERLGLTPARASVAAAQPTRRARWAARWLYPLPGQFHRLLQPIYSELLDWNDATMFKTFLRLDACDDHITITCFAATDCGENEKHPPIEDIIRPTPNRTATGSGQRATPDDEIAAALLPVRSAGG